MFKTFNGFTFEFLQLGRGAWIATMVKDNEGNSINNGAGDPTTKAECLRQTKDFAFNCVKTKQFGWVYKKC